MTFIVRAGDIQLGVGGRKLPHLIYIFLPQIDVVVIPNINYLKSSSIILHIPFAIRLSVRPVESPFHL